jgi:hypothetical protein
MKAAPTIPVGPPVWDPVWDGMDRLTGYYTPEGRRCSMREWVYLYSPRETEGTTRRQWRKGWRRRRQVGQSFVGAYRISTVFLGLDHSFFEGPPLIFETMVFQRKLSWMEPLDLSAIDGKGVFPGRWYHKPLDDICERYPSREAALRGHWRVRGEVRRQLQLAHGPNGGWRGKK